MALPNRRYFLLLASLLSLSVSVLGFTPVKSSFQSVKNKQLVSSSFSLQASKNGHAPAAAAGLATAAIILANVLSWTPANAMEGIDVDNHYRDGIATSSSNILLAARSGGRSGGRAYRRSPSRMSSPSPRSSYSTYSRSTTIIRPTISAPPIVVSPFGGGFGYGYGYGSPFSGFGLGYGLGALNSAGDSIRDYRQESEIQQSKAELELARQKEAELEARIKQLEQGQQPPSQQQAPQLQEAK